MKVFSIFDSKAEAYLQPFFAPTEAVALRNFSQAVQDESSTFHKNAADYTLFRIGEFSEMNAHLTNEEANVSLGCAIEFLEKSMPTSVQIINGEG